MYTLPTVLIIVHHRMLFNTFSLRYSASLKNYFRKATFFHPSSSVNPWHAVTTSMWIPWVQPADLDWWSAIPSVEGSHEMGLAPPHRSAKLKRPRRIVERWVDRLARMMQMFYPLEPPWKTPFLAGFHVSIVFWGCEKSFPVFNLCPKKGLFQPAGYAIVFPTLFLCCWKLMETVADNPLFLWHLPSSARESSWIS